MKHFIFVLFAALTGLFFVTRPSEAPKILLSEYGFFRGELQKLEPADGVFHYEVNAPLFSDYAEKARFIYLPDGARMTYQEKLAFDFPAGSVLIKNFYYPVDARQPEKGRYILETRLLLREEKGWKALEYLWNKDQTDARLEVAGASFPHNWINADGKKQSIEYIAPNLNQCKGCHSYDGQFVPLGVSARQLHRDDQLARWRDAGLIDLPAGFDENTAPHLTDYSNTSAPIQDRARAYLDGNCGHCHNAHGPASTSGMFLDIFEQNPERLGVNKAPVAAGRGSGKRQYGIVPGKPGESILVYRMENDDPGIRMPELGRQLLHKEGVEIVREWIKNW